MDAFRRQMAQKNAPDDLREESVDDFLGGAIRLIQPRGGYRVSMDTVMLAAAVPAKTGETVLEGGVGTGGAALCLARRLEGVHVEGVDLQEAMVHAARRNILFNDLSDRVSVRKGDIREREGVEARYDHVMMNPPYLAAGKALRPPEAGKGQAHMDENGTLKDWVRFALFHTKIKGTITIVFRADRLDELIAELRGRVGDLALFPLWPRQGQPAKRMIVQGRKGTQGAARLLPGLALHGDAERYTEAAQAVLWDGAPLDLKAFAAQR